MSIASRQRRSPGRARATPIAFAAADQPPVTTLPLAIGFGLLRALAATAAGLILACGVGVLIWAVTPGSPGAGGLVRGAIAAFGAANFLPPSVDGVRITATPLLLSAVCFGAVASAGNLRFGRRGPLPGMPGQLLVAVLTGVGYGAFTAAAVAALAPPGTGAERVERPIAFGVVAAVAGLTVRGKEFRRAFRAWAPPWLRHGLRAGAAAVALIAAGGALTLVAGLVHSFGTATDLTASSAPGFGDGVGMLLLGLAYLPNAVVAGIGYSSGVGFVVGGGSYSPLGSVGVELPGLPLLAAVPGNPGVSWPGLLSVLFPLAAGLLTGWVLIRSVREPAGRVLGAVVAAVLVAAVNAVLAAVAGGGIEGSAWARLTVPWWSGLVVGGVVGVLAVAVAGLSAVRVLSGRSGAGADADVAATGGTAAEPDATQELTGPIPAVDDDPDSSPAAAPEIQEPPTELDVAESPEDADAAEGPENAENADEGSAEPSEFADASDAADAADAADTAEDPENTDEGSADESSAEPSEFADASDASDAADTPDAADASDTAAAKPDAAEPDERGAASADVDRDANSGGGQVVRLRATDPTESGPDPAH